jgi:hypothetical protein
VHYLFCFVPLQWLYSQVLYCSELDSTLFSSHSYYSTPPSCRGYRIIPLFTSGSAPTLLVQVFSDARTQPTNDEVTDRATRSRLPTTYHTSMRYSSSIQELKYTGIDTTRKTMRGTTRRPHAIYHTLHATRYMLHPAPHNDALHLIHASISSLSQSDQYITFSTSSHILGNPANGLRPHIFMTPPSSNYSLITQCWAF